MIDLRKKATLKNKIRIMKKTLKSILVMEDKILPEGHDEVLFAEFDDFDNESMTQ